MLVPDSPLTPSDIMEMPSFTSLSAAHRAVLENYFYTAQWTGGMNQLILVRVLEARPMSNFSSGKGGDVAMTLGISKVPGGLNNADPTVQDEIVGSFIASPDVTFPDGKLRSYLGVGVANQEPSYEVFDKVAESLR